MRKQQWILIFSGILVLAVLLLFGNTVQKNKPSPPVAAASEMPAVLKTDEVLAKYKSGLDARQLKSLDQLENNVAHEDIQDQKEHAYHKLASYWGDSLNIPEIGAYYSGEAAKLENSEKNLTFAAHLLLDRMMSDTSESSRRWMATQAKELFDKALVINPNNDSSKVGVGVCYMFGDISDNPMQGILAVKEIADKDPGNLYAQMMLGMGGIQSGQYDKAAERFLAVISRQPGNIQAILSLAAVYEQLGKKEDAIKWYKESLKFIPLPQTKAEIEERIKSLQ